MGLDKRTGTVLGVPETSPFLSRKRNDERTHGRGGHVRRGGFIRGRSHSQGGGLRVIGVGLRLFEVGGWSGQACCGLRDIDDARGVANKLGIPFYLLDFRDAFHKLVIGYFLHGYLSEETPNPCIACNRWIKFQILLRRCLAWGADFLATGHHVRLLSDGKGEDTCSLLKSRDENKDQSYFLYMLGQKQLSRLLFPLGGLTKSETRSLAAEQGLEVHNKKDSQDICFLGGQDYGSFLMAVSGGVIRTGPVLDEKGEVIGFHRGLPLYTIGQRKGLGVRYPGPWYVVNVNRERNALIVDHHPPRFRRMYLREVSLVSWRTPNGPLEVMAKLRHREKESRALFFPLPGGKARLEFMEPVEAAAPGQAAVLYQGDRLIGGGTLVDPDVSELAQ